MEPVDKSQEIVWEEFISAKGAKYEIGTVKKPEASATTEETANDVNGKHDFGITCDWYPCEFENWKNTSADFQGTTAISRYSVNQNIGTYSYIINFTNNEHYDYYFFDETGDSYECNTFRNGNHYVRYNSNKPRIVFIKGD